MTPVKQRYENDCLKACVASVLNMDYDAVPHFYDGLEPGDAVTAAAAAKMTEFFFDHAIYPIQIPMGASSLSELAEAVGEHHPDLHFIVSGKSACGVHHAVVCCGGVMVHDPGRSNSGLTAPMDDGLWHVLFVGLAV